MPVIAAVKPRLALMLRDALGNKIPDCEEESTMHLKAWMLTLGAIAATGTEHRRWYTERLSQVLNMIGGENWLDFVNIMRSHLWWDYVCQEPAKIVWIEVQILHSMNQSSTEGEPSNIGVQKCYMNVCTNT